MSNKGYPSQDKNASSNAQHVTVEPVRRQQHGMSVVSHEAVRLVANDAVEASSTVRVINATAHLAQAGDVIWFTSGALDGVEVKVQEVDTNTITLVEDLVSAPAAAVTFEILRHKFFKVSPDGTILTTPGPLQFVYDGVDTEVEEDTGTPANNRPLPVKLTGVTGDINITAGDLNVQLSHVGANFDSTRIGDGTNVLAVDGDNEIGVKVSSSALPSGAATSAAQATAQTTLDAISSAQATAAKQDLLLAELQLKADLTDTQPVSAASLPLPTGAATAANQATLITDSAVIASSTASTAARVGPTNDLPLVADGDNGTVSQRVQRVAVNVTTMSAKLPATLGQKAMTASLAVALASDQSAIPVNISAPAAGTITQDDIAVGTTAVRITVSGSAPNAARKRLRFQPDSTSAARFFYGSSGVTTSTGVEIFPAQSEEMLNDASDYYIISDTAAQVVRVLEVV